MTTLTVHSPQAASAPDCRVRAPPHFTTDCSALDRVEQNAAALSSHDKACGDEMATVREKTVQVPPVARHRVDRVPLDSLLCEARVCTCCHNVLQRSGGHAACAPVGRWRPIGTHAVEPPACRPDPDRGSTRASQENVQEDAINVATMSQVP